MSLLDGKVAIVTGAGRGIGRGEALLLASHGASVVVNDMGGEWDGTGGDNRPAQQVVDEIVAAGGDAIANYDDVADFGAAERMVASAIQTWGTLDILVCNAGILRDKMIFNLTEEDWDSVIRVHLKGHFAPTRAACAYWRAKSKETGASANGRIVMTSSTSGVFGNAGQTNYGAAKAGIASFAQIVSLEMARYGVTCNAITPAARTRMTERTFGDLSSKGGFDEWDPENVAPVVVYLATDQAAQITGQVLYIAGGTVKVLEGWLPFNESRKTERWTVEELIDVVPALFKNKLKDKPLAYAPPGSELQASLQGK